MWRTESLLLFSLMLFLSLPVPGDASAVLSHEAIIDAVWVTHIQGLLQQRFPHATPEELRRAHAYAYGGAIIQDMGYYPYGSKYFSDLTHYVRSGDFILALLHDARGVDEFAFAIGAMSHYAADNESHRLAVNLVVPMLYPELKKKYGDVVTYEDHPLAHVKTEFGFDVLEIAKKRYASDAYHDFIGFEVAQGLLERAFRETYGLDLRAVLMDEDKAIGSYRRDISKLIPKATRIAWQVKQDEIEKDLPGATRDKFLYNLSQSSYEKRWGKTYRRPSTGEKVWAFFFRLIPKIGPLKILTFRTPTPVAEKMFEASFNAALDRYRSLLAQLGTGRVALPNCNFDVGTQTVLGKYRLSDETYADLLHRLAEQNFVGLTPDLRADVERYYAGPASVAVKQDPRRSARIRQELDRMKSVTAFPSLFAEPSPPERIASK